MDVEINDVHYAWSQESHSPNTLSLQAVLAHELGHVLGLDHACIPGKPQQLVEKETGITRLPCSAPVARSSIMYPSPIEQNRPVVLVPNQEAVATVCQIYRNWPISLNRHSYDWNRREPSQ